MIFTTTLRFFKSVNKIYICNVRNCSVGAKASIDTKCDVEERILKVAIIGVPNAGKSTFINNIMDRKVCATSSKVHTTRAKSSAVFTEENSQIVFLDTPGLVNQKEIKKFNLGRPFSKDSKWCLQEADFIGVIHDVSNVHTRERLDLKVIKLLETDIKKPSFLVLNKIDLLKSKRKLLDITRLVTDNCINGKLMPNCVPVKPDPDRIKGWPNFQDIFMVSALTGNGLDELKNYLVTKTKPGKWLYPANVWSDMSPETIILNTVKGQFLNFLQQEIPYSLTYELEFFDVNSQGLIKSVVVVKCPTDRIMKLIAGASDGRIRQITEKVQADLQQTFQNFVRLNIILLTSPDKK